MAQLYTVTSPFLENYVSFQLPTLKLFALTDSGAEISCINPTLFKHNEFQKFKIHAPDRDYIETATGDRTAIQGMIFARPKVDGRTVTCKLYIVPNVQPTLILGRDFMCENEVGLRFHSNGKMSLTWNPKRQIVSKDQVTIPPKSQVVLIARIKGAPLPHDVTGVTSGSPNLCSLGLLPTKSLSVNKHGFIQYGCANFQNEPVVLQKGAVLGNFTCLSHKYQVSRIPEDGDNGHLQVGDTQDHQGKKCTNHPVCMYEPTDKLDVGSCMCACTGTCMVNNGTGIQSMSAGNTCSDVTHVNATDSVCKVCCNSTGIDDHSETTGSDVNSVYKVSQLVDLSKSDVTHTQGQQLLNLLDKYNNVFVGPDQKLGKCDIVQHKIELDSQHRPIRQRYYQLGPRQKVALEEMIQDMEKQDIIERSTSPWGAPCLLVAKPNNKGYRFVVDYRGINKLIELQAQPLPTTEEALSNLGSAQPTYFTTLDLQSGFYQITIDPESRPYTAFRCHLGLFQFKRLPMGLKNSPATFQRVMEAVLHGLNWKYCLIYMDDVLLYSANFKLHLQHIESVLQRLASAGLKLRPDKCQFARKSLHYLGHVVDSNGISPDPAKIDAVSEYPIPANLKALRAFLGLSGYYRRFIRDYAHIAAPLYALTKKGVAFDWSTDCQHAFESLKSALTSPPVLAYPDYDRPFKLYTDASSFAVGGVLGQDDAEGKERVVCYVGRSLTSQERNYGISEKECLALVYCVRKLDCYLRYSSFTAIVDHSSLRWLFSLQQPTGKFARWVTLLQSYSFTIQHRPGQVHQNADGISRREYAEPTQSDLVLDDWTATLIGTEYDFPETTPKTGQISVVSAAKLKQRAQRPVPTAHHEQAQATMTDFNVNFEREKFCQLQHEDPVYHSMIEFLQSGVLPDDDAKSTKILKTFTSYFLSDNLLYHVWIQPGKGDRSDRTHVQLAIPQAFVPTILAEYHDSSLAGGHMGIARTMEKVRAHCFWPTMYKDVVTWVQSCVPCNRRKSPSVKVHAKIIPMPVPTVPFERLSTDILGPLPACRHTGNRYVIVFIDYFTKYVELVAVPDIKAETVARSFVKEVVCRHGTPLYLHSDRGTNYLSNIVRETCKILQVTKTHTTSYHPQCNGQSERMMSVILASLAKRLDEQHDTWDQHLPFVQFVHNTTPCLDSTRYTPAFLAYGRHPRSPLDHLLPQIEEPPKSAQLYVADLMHVLESARQDAACALKESKTRMVDKLQSQIHEPLFHVGDSVYLYHPILKTDQSKKFQSPWSGPHYVVQKYSNIHVQLRRHSDNTLIPGRIHINRLKHATDRSLVNPAVASTVPAEQDMDTVSTPHGGTEKLMEQIPSKPDTSVISQPEQVHSQLEQNARPVDQTDKLLSQPDNCFYEVEKLIAKRKVHPGENWQYRVKWLTFPSSANSWVSFADLNPSCQNLALKLHDSLPTYQGKKRLRKKCKL